MKASKNRPLVSVIVPTKNSGEFLEACLRSIREQTYKNIELIVVDNHSTDETPSIATRYADAVYSKGPERSAQRNFGVKKAKGLFVAIIDSDMNLDKTVISECVEAMQPPAIHGVIIPEESFGKGFWAQCKRLEKSFYLGIDWIEAARFFRRSEYTSVGGYNENLVSGEDWDLSNRMRELGTLARTKSFIQHNEGHISLLKTLRKKYYYASQINQYVNASKTTSTRSEIMRVFRRFWMYFSHPTTLMRHPIIGVGMIFMKLMEFLVGAVAFCTPKKDLTQENKVPIKP